MQRESLHLGALLTGHADSAAAGSATDPGYPLASVVPERDPALHGSSLASREQRVLVIAPVEHWCAIGVEREAACAHQSQDSLADLEREPRHFHGRGRAGVAEGLPTLPIAELVAFINRRDTMDETSLLRAFRDLVHVHFDT